MRTQPTPTTQSTIPGISSARRRWALQALVLLSSIAMIQDLCAGSNSSRRRGADLSDWAPANTLIYLEIRDGAAAYDRLLSSGPLQDLWRSEPAQHLKTRPEVLMGLGGIAAFEIASEAKLEAMLREIAGRHLVAVAGPPRSPGQDLPFALVARLEDSKMARTGLDGLAKLSGEDSLSLSSQGTRGDVMALGEKGHLYLDEELLVVANDREWARSIVDLHQGEGEGLSSKDAFAEVESGWKPDQLVHGYVDLAFLREATPGSSLIAPESWQNPLAHLLLGGLAEIANRSDASSLTLSLDDDGLELAFEVSRVDADEPFFGKSPQKKKRPWLASSLLDGSFHRDLDAWWERGYEVYGQRLAPEIAEFESVMALFFGGKPFIELLEAMDSEIEFTIVEQDFDDVDNPPVTRLPGFVLVLHLDSRPESEARDRERLERDLLIAFQTAIGIVNADRAQKGQSLLMLGSETVGDTMLQTAVYRFLETDEPLPFEANFTPAMAIHDQTLILSTSKQTASEILAAMQESERVVSETVADDLVEIDSKALASILRQNRQSMMAKAILEEGKSEERAVKDFEIIMGWIDSFEGLGARVTRDGDRCRLSLELGFRHEVSK